MFMLLHGGNRNGWFHVKTYTGFHCNVESVYVLYTRIMCMYYYIPLY